MPVKKVQDRTRGDRTGQHRKGQDIVGQYRIEDTRNITIEKSLLQNKRRTAKHVCTFHVYSVHVHVLYLCYVGIFGKQYIKMKCPWAPILYILYTKQDNSAAQ
jgi:hypothetical protein